jgi:predicted metalloprotease with PDZ domain
MLHRILTHFVVFSIVWMDMIDRDAACQASATESNAVSTIQYRLSFRQAETHRVDIELSVPTEGKDDIELMMPVWTPGSYLVREYARQIEQISAADGTTAEILDVEKKDKNHWRVRCKGANEILVRYSLYCREMSVRTNWVEREFAFLTGAATFLSRSDMLDHPHIVRIDALPHWPNIATSLRAIDPRDPWTRISKNYDELVDSPIVLGAIDVQSFDTGGARHHLATLGADSFWDTPAAARDVAKIVKAEQAFWGEVPYKEYWFLNLVTETGGGLEHDDSCVLMTGRWTQKQKSKYIDWLGLVSHEFFHVWNVRRLRPKVLKEYDYNNEQYFRELWIAEGITSYYDDLIVARAGLCTPKDYLDRISKSIAAVQNSPGRLAQSLSESSFDSWIKFYRPDENASNSRISYYIKGALVGMLLDVQIRSDTAGARSLDDAMRSLWESHRETGYTNEDFVRIVESLTSKPYGDWFKKALESTEELDYSNFLNWYGLEWKKRETDKDAANGKSSPNAVFIGLELKPDQGKAMVDKVTRDTPASIAGFNVGDELFSLDGLRVSAEGWTERVNFYEPEDVVQCLVSRRGKIIELTMKLQAVQENTWNLVRVGQPTDEQEKHWKNWLGLPESDSPSEIK